MSDTVVSNHLVHLEFALAFIIEHCGITQPRAARRLNGFENTIAALARPWRQANPIIPSRELTMSGAIRDDFLEWVEADELASGPTRERVTIYASGSITDDTVPIGWVRLTLTR
jgi:hypothetical protein